MGIAAYNRGSAAIARGIQMDHGTWREPSRPTPRPATWGSKTQVRAKDHAVRLLLGLRRRGTPVDDESMSWFVAERARCGIDTALEAVRLAGIEHPEATPVRVAHDTPRLRVATETEEHLVKEEAEALAPAKRRTV